MTTNNHSDANKPPSRPDRKAEVAKGASENRSNKVIAPAHESQEAPLSYDSKTIALHWITAALVVTLWCLGQTIDWFPRGTGRITARSVHICLGVTLGLILCFRLYWRIFAGRRLPPATSGLIQTLSTLVHFALYAALLGTVVLGVANAWIRGDTLFNLFTIPAFDPGNKGLREQVENLHGLFANGLLILVGFHAAAALVHHFLLRDNVLRRMLPSCR
jgi:cytochrome b561